MTNIEPPSGYDDLAAQAEQLQRERDLLEQEKALVRAQRTPSAADSGAAAGPATAPAVIDPSGVEFELDADGQVYRDDEGQPVPKWTGEVVELNGRQIQVRKPKPEALQAFALAASKYTPARTQTNMVALFVRNHVSAKSFNELMLAMMNPNDPNPFVMDDFGKLMQEIAKLGSARPTGPSRS
ncbi:hypothetical protein [Nocardia gipuzkoensis]|uniref:hypothetical protein n=1 Tax=Nocardia gipuzkoensis TaxID=2749991 RepID=UPI00237D6B3E|nr:hypothetical protein [Nocardia gipuzkoensis]MDE1675135.1 hypothetical protein [Nocardia gipuzkoensis]